MSIWAYLGIALVTMEADALACAVAGVRYRVTASAVCSILWPVTAPFVIAGVVMCQGQVMQHLKEQAPK